MPKLTLNPISAGYASNMALNTNNTLIETALENTISRNGASPNHMLANLDMNGYMILNQSNPVQMTGFVWEGPWVTATLYHVGDIVQENGSAYICIVEHTSGTFATDLTALKWQLFTAASFPNQTGHAGEFLKTNGTSVLWGLAVDKTSATGSASLPVGTTAQRDATPVSGYLRFNSSYAKPEIYTGASWSGLGGAAGAGGDDVFYENGQTVTTNYTLTTGKNAMSAGPITIADGVTVTVPTGATWSVI